MRALPCVIAHIDPDGRSGAVGSDLIRTDPLRAPPHRPVRRLWLSLELEHRARVESPACIDTAPKSLPHRTTEPSMSLGTILLIVLILLLVGAIPAWPH